MRRKRNPKVKKDPARVFYVRRPEMETAEEKLSYLGHVKASAAPFVQITPDDNANWINLNVNEWDDLVPIADKKTKSSKVKGQERAIFKTFGNGINTARDQWVFDLAEANVRKKREGFHRVFTETPPSTPDKELPKSIKWSRNLKNKLRTHDLVQVDDSSPIVPYNYRPFFKGHLNFSALMLDEKGYSVNQEGPADNRHIAFPNGGHFRAQAASGFVDFHFVGDARVCSRFRFDSTGERLDNITDWALAKFTAQYKPLKITKDDIFAFVYAGLHDPIYRETYALNLKREFPRIPFYPDFTQMARLGPAPAGPAHRV